MNEWPLWEIFIRASTGSRTGTSAACTRPTRGMAIKNARDVYTRRNEGVSIWAVRSADVVASAPGDKERAVRACQQQGLPASDVLSDARRSEAPVSIRPETSRARPHDSRPTALPVPAAARRFAAHPRAAPRRMGGPRPDARGGHRADERRPRSPRPGAHVALLCGRGRGAVRARTAATRTSSRSCGTRASFRNLLLVEQPNGNFADTTARQFLFDAWHLLLLRALAHSSDARIAGIAAKAAKEAAYHVERSGDWVIRLGDGTDESHARMQAAIDDVVDVHRRDVHCRMRSSSS